MVDRPEIDDDAVKRAFGARIKTLREQASLTQEQLAERVGRSRDTIAAIERGVNSPRLTGTAKLAAALGVSLPELFDYDDAPPARDKDKRRAVQTLLRLVQHEDVATIKQVTRQARLLIQFVRGAGEGAGGR